MRRILFVVTAVVIILLLLLFFAARRRSVPETGKALSATEALGGTPAQGFARAAAPRRFIFPEDHGPHQGFRNEWWYFTGNLESSQGRRFGYQLTFFRVALTPEPVPRISDWGTNEVFMAHFAVTDVEGKQFHFSERFSRAALGLAGAGGRPLTVRLEDWTALESSAQPWSVKLSAADADMAIELDLTSLKREILNGASGLSSKSGTPGNASYYYSISRMATSGTIRSGSESFKVTGLSWLDREWSTSALEPDQVGWDWFALQLDDGRDIMFYQLRRRDGSSDPFSSGTLVSADGTGTHLRRDEVQLEATRWWTSPKTGVKYPSLWRMRIPSQRVDIEISPRLAGQEFVGDFRYWEGAVVLQGAGGSAGGSGYLEMTGY